VQNVIYSIRCAGLKSLLVHAHRFRVTDFSNAKGDKKWMITTTTTTTTGVDFPKILGGQTKILGAEGGKKWQMHGRFSIIGGTCPGCSSQSLRLWLRRQRRLLLVCHSTITWEWQSSVATLQLLSIHCASRAVEVIYLYIFRYACIHIYMYIQAFK